MNNIEKLRNLESKRDLLATSINLLKEKLEKNEITLTDFQSIYAIKQIPDLENIKLSNLNRKISALRESLQTKPKTHKPYAFAAFIIIGLVLFATLLGQSNITGLFTYEDSNYQDMVVDQTFINDKTIDFNITNLLSLKVIGHLSYTEESDFEILLSTDQGNFVVLDKAMLLVSKVKDKSQKNLITGMVVDEEVKEVKEDKKNQIVNLNKQIKTKKINISLTPTKEIKDTALNLTKETLNITEPNNPLIEANETIKLTNNLTLNVTEINKTINITKLNTTIKESINITENIIELNVTNKTSNFTDFNKTINLIINLEDIKGLCKETCNLNELSSSSIIINVNGAKLYIEKFIYTQNVENVPPKQIKQFANLSAKLNQTYNYKLSEYFTDKDKLTYDFKETKSFNIDLKQDKLFFTPQEYGEFTFYVYAFDGESLIKSNSFTINVASEEINNESIKLIESLEQKKAIILEPVKWKKTIDIKKPHNLKENFIEVNTNLPEGILNLTITAVSNKTNTSIDSALDNKINLNRAKEFAKLKDSLETISEVSNNKKVKSDIKQKVLSVNSKLASVEQEITSEQDNLIREDLELIFNVPKDTEKVLVEYETEAPKIIEETITSTKKLITVSSDIHYKNITARSFVDDKYKQTNIKLYHYENNKKIPISKDSIEFIDENNNSFIDYIQWIVPHLSNQTYEIEIAVLNPYTYLKDNETWYVRFDTTGTGNLSISSPNSYWEEIQLDNNQTVDEMRFLDITCGNNSLLNDLKIIDENNNVYNYSELTLNDSIKPSKFFIEDYSCENTTGEFTNYMNIAGYATIAFEFSNQNATVTDYAYDPCTPPGSGDWDVSGTELCEDQTITIAGHINIEVSDQLILKNVTLQIAQTASWNYDINVYGNLTVNGSSVIEEEGDNLYVNLYGYDGSIINFTDTNISTRVRTQIFDSDIYFNNVNVNFYFYLYEPNSVFVSNNSYINRAFIYVEGGGFVNITNLYEDVPVNINVSSVGTDFTMNLTNTEFNMIYLYNNGGNINLTNSNIYQLIHYNYDNDDVYISNSQISYLGYFAYQPGSEINIDNINPPHTNWDQQISPTNGGNNILNLTNSNITALVVYSSSAKVNITNSTLSTFYSLGTSENYLVNSTITSTALFNSVSSTTIQNSVIDSASRSRIYDNAIINFTQPSSSIEDFDLYGGATENNVLHGYFNITSVDAWTAGHFLNRFFPFNVTTSGGDPVNNANVIIKNSTGSTINTGSTGADGIVNLNITDTADNTYMIYIDDAWKTNITMLESTAPAGIQLNLDWDVYVVSSNLGPAVVDTTDDLIGNVTCSDPDLNNLTVYWKVFNNSVEVISEVGTANVTKDVSTNVKNISSSLTTIGEDWNIEFTCSNGTLNSSPSNTSVLTIQNALPSISGVILNSSSGNNLIADNLTVFISGGSDSDGDSITNITDWRKDGTSIAFLNMPFNTNDSSIAKDYSTFGSNGTINGATWTPSGKIGGAYVFDGDGDYIEGSTTSLVGTDDFSVALWVKEAGPASYTYLLSNGGGGGSSGFGFLTANVINGFVRFETYAVGGSRFSAIFSNTISHDNNWHYFVATVDRDDYLKVYLDGTYVTQTDISGDDGKTLDTANNLFIGKYGSGYVNGTIDEVKMYNYTLSAEQINVSYQAGFANHSVQTIVSQETFVGDNWTVAVTPNDAIGDGEVALSDSLIVVNALPSISGVVLNSSSGDNLTADNLTVFVSGGSDSDGDSITNITDWRKDGSSIAFLNMPFDTNDSSIAKDYSTFENNGTINGATWTPSGKVGGAYVFDGDGDYIEGSTTSLVGTDDFSVALWVKEAGPASYTYLLSNGGGGGSSGFGFLTANVINGYVRFETYAVGGSRLGVSFSNTIGHDNNWHYFVATVDRDDYLKVYLDGTYVTQTDISGDDGKTLDTANNLFIGKYGSGYVNGTIDEVKMYNYTLSAEQINVSYQAGFANHSVQTIVSNETSIGDNWSVAVTPNDGFGDGDSVLSDSLTILSSVVNYCNPTENLTLTENLSCVTLNISPDLTLNTSIYSINVTGEVIINGTLDASLGSTQYFGSLNVTENGTYIATANETILYGNFTRANAGVFTHNDGAIHIKSNTTFDSPGGSFNGAGKSLYNLILDDGITLNLNKITAILGKFTHRGLVDGSGNMFLITNDFGYGDSDSSNWWEIGVNGSFAETYTGDVVPPQGTGSITLPNLPESKNVYNLYMYFGYSRTTKIPSDGELFLENNLWVGTGGTDTITIILDTNGGNLNVGGTTSLGENPGATGIILGRNGTHSLGAVTINNNGTFNATNETTYLGGDFTNGGTFNHNQGTVYFNWSAATNYDITGSQDTTFYDFNTGGSSNNSILVYQDFNILNNFIGGSRSISISPGSKFGGAGIINLIFGNSTKSGTIMGVANKISSEGNSIYPVKIQAASENYPVIFGKDILWDYPVTYSKFDLKWVNYTVGLNTDQWPGRDNVTINVTGNSFFTNISLASENDTFIVDDNINITLDSLVGNGTFNLGSGLITRNSNNYWLANFDNTNFYSFLNTNVSYGNNRGSEPIYICGAIDGGNNIPAIMWEFDDCPDNLTRCTDLDHTNTIYYLSQDVQADSTCFNILADNVTLDCQGNTINYSAVSAGYGVNVTGYNLPTIKNCIIEQIDGTNTYSHAINFVSATNGTIHNNTLTTEGSGSTYVYNHGISFASNSNSNNITNNVIINNAGRGYGIILSASDRNEIYNNSLTTFENYLSVGLRLISSSDDNNIVDNNITTTTQSSHGVELNGVANNNLTNNNIYVNYASTGCCVPTFGIFFDGVVTGTVLRNNEINNSKGPAIGCEDSYAHDIDTSNLAGGNPILYNHSISDQTVYQDQDLTSYGQVICGGCNNVTYDNVTVDNEGLHLMGSDNSYIVNSNISSTTSTAALNFYKSTSNNISNNTISQYASVSYGVFFMYTSTDNIFSNNDVTTHETTSPTIKLYSSDSNTFIDNNLNTQQAGSFGVQVYGGSDNINLTSNNISTVGSSAHGYYIDSGIDNFMSNSNRITTTGSNSIAVYLSRTSTSTFTNDYYNATYSGVDDIYSGSTSTVANFTNVTYDKNEVGFSATAITKLNFFNYLNIHVNDSTSDVENANVSAWDKDGAQKFSILSNVSGDIPRQTLLEYWVNRTDSYYYSNFTVNATKSTYSDYSTSFNLTSSLNLGITLDRGNLSVDLISPPTSWFIDNSGIFECSYSDTIDLHNVSLYLNNSVWDINQTYSISGTSGVSMFNVSNLAAGNYKWNCKVCNDNNYCLFSTSNNTFTVEAVKPLISFQGQTPDNNTKNSTSNNFTFVNASVSDATNKLSSFIDWNNSLVGWWKFEDNYLDSSSYGNNGTCSAIACPNLTIGARGKGYNFDGIDDSISVNNHSSLYFGTDPFTISAWIKLSDLPNSIILQKGSIGVNAEYTLRTDSDGKLFIRLSDETVRGYIGRTSDSALTSDWQHIAVTFAGGTGSIGLRLYVNGVLVDSTDTNSGSYAIMRNNNAPLYFADDTVTDSNISLDEVQIFNRLLSADEIDDIFLTRDDELYNNFTDLSSGTYTYKAYAYDQAGNSNETEERIFKVNYVPSIVNVTISPPIPDADTNLNCTVAGWSDTDGDSAQYYFDWYLNDVLNSTILQSGASNVLGSGNTSYNDVWNCTVTPYDGYDNGTAFSDSVIIYDCGIDINTSHVLSTNISTCINDYIVNITADNVVFDCAGYTIQGTGDYGIYVDTQDNVTVKNCVVNMNGGDGDYGIYYYYSSNGSIYNNTIDVTDDYGIYLRSSGYTNVSYNTIDATDDYGIRAHYIESVYNNILYNNVTANDYGIELYTQASYSNISSNDISVVTYGVHLFQSSRNNISNNIVFYSNQVGILGNIGSRNSYFNNTITGDGDYGLAVVSDYTDNISFNNIDINGNYALLIDASDHTFVNNNIISGESMVVLLSATYNILLLNNNLTASSSNLIIDSSGGSNYNRLIYNNSYGEVKWNSTDLDISEAGALKLGTNIEITDNFIYFNSTAFASHSDAAELQFFSPTIPSGTIRPYKNGSLCSALICSDFSVANGNYNFSVTGFSNYSLGNNTAPTTPTLVSPENNSRQFGDIHILNWSASTDSEGNPITYYTYHENITLPTSSLSSTSDTNISSGVTIDGETYYWHVIAGDGWDNSSTSYTWNYLENIKPIVNTSRIYPILPLTSDNLIGYCNATDQEGDNITYHYRWYNGSELFNSGSTTTNYTQGLEINVNNLSSSSTANSNIWTFSCLAYDGYENSSIWRNSSVTVGNSAPNTPILLEPSDANSTLFNRSPTFLWNCTDNDSNSLNFTLEINNSVSPNYMYYNLSLTPSGSNYTYTIPDELQTFIESENNAYEWRVRAFDGINYSVWSEVYNFSIEEYVIITMVNNTIDFGSGLNLLNSYDTISDANPFLIRNDGNVNVTLINFTAPSFWLSRPLGTEYLQYKTDNYSSNSTYNYSGSVTSWTNFSSSNVNVTRNLYYGSGANYIETDLRILVPGAEPPGNRSPVFNFYWEIDDGYN